MKSIQRTPKTREEWAAVAHNAMEQKQFKEAITAYKELLKSKPEPAIEQCLAAAYRERAAEIAAKGMYPEAIVLWENQAKLVKQSPHTPDYVIWLFQAGLYARLASLVDDITQALEPDQARLVLETLAIMALDDSKLLTQFPTDHVIVRHHPVMLKALNAYVAGNKDELDTCLQQIPSRSPYREVRTLLKAFLLLEEDRQAGIALLDKISRDSAIRDMAVNIARHISGKGVDVTAFHSLGGKLQVLITKLNGYEKNQLNLLRELKKITSVHSDRVAFEFALSNRQIFGDDAVRRFCYAMLVEYPNGIKLYERNFGKVSSQEKFRIQALHDEHERYLDDAVQSWLDYMYKLGESPDSGSDNKQVMAMILRHCYSLAGSERRSYVLPFLIKSLEFDPADKASYVEIYKGYLESDPKLAQNYLEQGLKLYPKDVDLLMLAMNGAAERKSFKKAAGYARTILSIDSINSVARNFLIEAYLGHARKQIKTNRLDLAHHELDEARAIDVHQRNSSLHYLTGIVALKQGNAAGEESIRRGFATESSPLTAELGFMLELTQLERLEKRHPYPSCLSKNYQPDRNDMQSLARFISRLPDKHSRNLKKILNDMARLMYRGAAVDDLTENDYFDLCQAFLDIEEYDLLECFVQQFLKLNSYSPAAQFFSVMAQGQSDFAWMQAYGLAQLNAIRTQAENLGDTRTCTMIQRVMSNVMAKIASLRAKLDNDYFDDDIGHVDSEELEKIMKIVKEVEKLRDMSGKELRNHVASIYGKNAVRGLDHDELMNLALHHLLEQAGMDAADTFNALNHFLP